MLKNDKSHQDVLGSMVCYFLFLLLLLINTQRTFSANTFHMCEMSECSRKQQGLHMMKNKNQLCICKRNFGSTE